MHGAIMTYSELAVRDERSPSRWTRAPPQHVVAPITAPRSSIDLFSNPGSKFGDRTWPCAFRVAGRSQPQFFKETSMIDNKTLAEAFRSLGDDTSKTTDQLEAMQKHAS